MLVKDMLTALRKLPSDMRIAICVASVDEELEIDEVYAIPANNTVWLCVDDEVEEEEEEVEEDTAELSTDVVAPVCPIQPELKKREYGEAA